MKMKATWKEYYKLEKDLKPPKGFKNIMWIFLNAEGEMIICTSDIVIEHASLDLIDDICSNVRKSFLSHRPDLRPQ